MVRLLTTGQLPAEALRDHAETLRTEPGAQVADATLLEAFTEAQIASTPYAFARDVSGETTLALIEADPFANAEAAPILTDDQWVALQGICGG